ncbi:E3 ubiquitin-protein ligase MPSR1 [Lactuca sativa]|uniref:RING-type E3 ubiquitin transferase n=1 Tax=Lactuca sativa TaxID=4236 RepID=A0A9R1W4F3_LACSA|nr:E3 ubiquitin-protein ligase MPSR1 [Lactuca sativa]KAJ0215951.1 hypothetical protein LSAT_V11C300138670 [Lactuca sativa]
MSSSSEQDFDQSIRDFITSFVRTAVAAAPPSQDHDGEEAEAEAIVFTVYATHAGSLVKEGPLPASKAAIEAIPTVTATEGEDCAICLTDYSGVAGEAKELPCRHRYHSDCIMKWLGIHGSCPVCRYEMPVDEEEKRRRDGGDGEWWRVMITVERRTPVSESGRNSSDSVEGSGSSTDYMDID